MNTDKLKELLAAATPGPWRWSENGNIVPVGYPGEPGKDIEIAAVYSEDDNDEPGNSKLIVAAVNSLPSLIARLEAAEKVVEAGRKLAGAGDYALWQHNGGGTPMHNHWSASMERTVSDFRTALTTYDQEKAREHG